LFACAMSGALYLPFATLALKFAVVSRLQKLLSMLRYVCKEICEY